MSAGDDLAGVGRQPTRRVSADLLRAAIDGLERMAREQGEPLGLLTVRANDEALCFVAQLADGREFALGCEWARPVTIFRQSGGQIAELFADRGPIAHVGRRSIPKSYRGEGDNYVD